jgi:hypothetical protein
MNFLKFDYLFGFAVLDQFGEFRVVDGTAVN